MILFLLSFLSTFLFALFIANIRETKLPKHIEVLASIISVLFFVIIISPLSFIGIFLDRLIVFGLIVYWLIKLITNKRASIRSVKIQIWILFGFEVIFGIILFISIFVGDDYLSKIQPEKVTKSENYRLVHRKINSDFMCHGDYEITINKQVKSLPFLEIKKGVIAIGPFDNSYLSNRYEYKIIDEKLYQIDVFSNSKDVDKVKIFEYKDTKYLPSP